MKDQAKTDPMFVIAKDGAILMRLTADGTIEFPAGRPGEAAKQFCDFVAKSWRSAMPPAELRLADEVVRLKAALLATEEALTDCTDRTEQARELCRAQIQRWRSQGRTWIWIESQPATRAFYGPLAGS